MVERPHSGTAELGAPMDYPEHERTYSGFITFTKLGILASVITMISLILFGFGGGAGFWLGTLMLILMALALAIGLVAKGSTRPLIAVLVIGLVLVALSVG
jgi:hypothetical protein